MQSYLSSGRCRFTKDELRTELRWRKLNRFCGEPAAKLAYRKYGMGRLDSEKKLQAAERNVDRLPTILFQQAKTEANKPKLWGTRTEEANRDNYNVRYWRGSSLEFIDLSSLKELAVWLADHPDCRLDRVTLNGKQIPFEKRVQLTA